MGKFTKLDGRSTPPILPLNWADWEADEHVKQMNETMQGVYFLILKALWKEDEFEFDYLVLTDTIKAKDWRNVRKFLEKWGHLFRCVECEGALDPRWGHAQGTHPPCRYCVGVTHCSCTGDARFAYHSKLKNYKKQALSGSRLGTIQSKAIQSNSSQSKLNEVSEETTFTEEIDSEEIQFLVTKEEPNELN